MAWKILFYETASGKSPIKKFLDTLQPKAQRKILAYLDLLQKNGTKLASNYLEKVSGDIWALRPEFGGIEYRIFFFTESDETIVVHVILKNTRRIPPNDIETAKRRMGEWLKRKKEEK